MKHIGIFDKLNFDFTGKEKIFFPAVFLILIFLSFYFHDSKIALISAIFGVSYTVLNGKRKIYCYFFGIIATFCYSYLAFKNGLVWNFALNFFYYLPIQIIGVINWKKHLIDKVTVEKTSLKPSKRCIFFGILSIISLISAFFVFYNHLAFLTLLDFLTTLLSVSAMILAVKRCVEQWYLWSAVNFISMVMWIIAYINGSNCLNTILMWLIYLILGIYFLKEWQKKKSLKSCRIK